MLARLSAPFVTAVSVPRASLPSSRRQLTASRLSSFVSGSPVLASPISTMGARQSRRALAASASSDDKYTMADQVARHAKAVGENNPRVLDIDSIYDGTYLKGKTVMVTGGNRGIGLALVQECVAQGAKVIASCRSSSKELDAVPGVTIIHDIDVSDTASVSKLAVAVTEPIDILINNAGYFYEPVESIDNLNFEEELKMIDICAVGPLRVVQALYKAGLIAKPGGKVVMITSQGGSIAWRTVQNPDGKDYGHHMSKAAANMMGVLLSQELKHEGILVTNLHPGFNKTGMTSKYQAIWEEEGAVDASVGAKRVMHEVSRMTMDNVGKLINCEDGLEIPW